MKPSYFKSLRSILLLSFLTLFLTSCTFHKNILNGNTDFQSLVNHLVLGTIPKSNFSLGREETILVSDFVNINDQENRTQLGFLLSSLLKDEVSKLNFIVREVTFRKDFQLGDKGFDVLSRNKNHILNTKVPERFVYVGTYSITNKSLNLFLKLIEIETGKIVASSFVRTNLDDEIKNLNNELIRRNGTLRPRIVL